MEIYPKEINEVRYYKGEIPYANFEYNTLKDSITFNCPEKKMKILFNSENPKDIQNFWDNLARNSSDRQLKNLNKILEEMKEKFIMKD